jgi:carotenoid cleavage dioxygenase-like enzyme
LGELPLAMTFDPDTLRSTGWLDQNPDENSERNQGSREFREVPAHPQRDFDRKLEYNVHTLLGANPRYEIVATDYVSGTKSVVSRVPVQAGNPGYRHHFSLTQNYLIVMEYPLGLDMQALAAGDKPFAASFRWDNAASTKIFIVSRTDGTLLKTLETDGFFALHHANAYETGDVIVMDVAAYDNAEHISDYYFDRRRRGAPLSLGQLRRYTLPLGTGTEVTCEVLSSQQVELPTYNYGRLNGRSYRYVYAAGMRQDLPEVAYNQIVKADVRSHVSLTWFEDGCFPGEPIFVPAPGGTSEDDGVLLCLVLDTRTHTSFLLVLDAIDLGELARAQLDTFIPYGLHGQYLGDHYSTL